MAKRSCPIEMEPRTLNQDQFTLAREGAVDIFHKEESNEGSDIFIQDLKPVTEIKAEEIVYKAKGITKHEKSTTMHGIINETCCKCLCKSAIMDTPKQTNLKEPLSAPF